MGVDLAFASLAIRRGHEPDWLSAAQAIQCLDLATIWDTGDDFFPWEDWLMDGPNVPAAVGVYTSLRAAQRDLRNAAAQVRGAIEGTWPGEVLLIELPAHRVYATGGETVGEPPSELFVPFREFAESGAARAAGFEWWAQYAHRGIDQRRLDFDGDAMRSVHAAGAFLFAEDAALQQIKHYSSGDPQEWLQRLQSPLRRAREEAHDRQAAGRWVMRFLGEVLALMLALEDLAPNRNDLTRDEIVREHVELLDHVSAPPRGSLREVVELLEGQLMPFSDMLPTLAGRGDRDWADQLARDGGSLASGIATELSVSILSEGLTAIVDVFGDGVVDIRPVQTADPIDAVAAPPPRTRLRRPPGHAATEAVVWDYRPDVAWCAATAFDWDAGFAAIDRRPAEEADQLRADLDELRVIVDGQYSRLVTSLRIGDLSIWMTEGVWRDGWTLVRPLRRLGCAGVLAASGAVAWG
jgi:hypothetical protein